MMNSTMETFSQVEVKSPFVENIGEHSWQTEEEQRDFDTEFEIPPNQVNALSIQDNIRLQLTGSVGQITLSQNDAQRQNDLTNLFKSLAIKVFTKINDPAQLPILNQFVSTFPLSATKLIIQMMINHVFTFKRRVVQNATSEYNTWLTTKVNNTWAIKEYDAPALPLLTKYWNATPSPPSPINPHTFWSAAFISFVMKQSGAEDLFKYSNAHITYIRAAKRNRDRNIENPFRLYTITEFIRRMQPGDLVCKARDGSGLNFSNVMTNTQTAAHVDVITEIDRANNTLRVVGGNVCDNVDNKGLRIIGNNRIVNSDNDDYFAGIGIGNV